MNLIIYLVFYYVVFHTFFLFLVLFIRTIFPIPLEYSWKKEILDLKVHQRVGKYVLALWALIISMNLFLILLIKIKESL